MNYLPNFNETNLKLQLLQGNQLNVSKTKSVMSEFVANLFLCKQNLGTGECSQFSNLLKLQNRDKDLLAYSQNLTALHADLRPEPKICRHSSLLDISEWQLNSLAHGQSQVQNTDEYILIQEQLIEISTNEELKPMFGLG